MRSLQLPVLAITSSIAICLLALAAPPEGYRLAWADEFDGEELDASKWDHRGLGKRRDAINDKDAVTVRDGVLTITTWTEDGMHHTGMIATADKFESAFGYYEARIRFEDSPGMWSAWWSQTPTMGQHIGDPARAGMEIDILEHRVLDKSGRNLAGKVQHTLHWDGYGKDHQSAGKLTDDFALGEGWHVYGLEWTPEEYHFYVDGKLTWTSGPVSGRPQFQILSSEVHDGRWAGTVPEGGYGSRAASRTKFLVDYVRFYEPPKD